ncbi:MAG: TetR/AcrR family transcriptional regulator [Tetrasphaera sp.]
MPVTSGPTTTMPTAAPTGQSKRRARTHAALLGAARELLVERRESASIEEITKRAGVGFGSFFNHFPGGKDELFSEAVLDLLDRYAEWVDAATADLTDPAEIFAASFRLTGRLALAQPHLLAPLLARGTVVLTAERGLRTQAMRDIRAGIAGGRFVDQDPEVLMMLAGGVLLSLVQVALTRGDAMPVATVDEVVAAALRMLGVPPGEASKLVTRPLPDALPPTISVRGAGA